MSDSRSTPSTPKLFSTLELLQSKPKKPKKTISPMEKLSDLIESIDDSKKNHTKKTEMINKIVASHSEIELESMTYSLKGMQILVEALKKNESLHSLGFSEIESNDDELEHIVIDGLSHMNKLKKLQIAFEDWIGEESTVAFMKALKNYSNLNALDITDLNLNSESMSDFCEILTKNKNLTTLRLGHIYFGFEFAKLLMNTINTCSTINKLDLTVIINEDNIEAIKDGLKTNSSIKTLRIVRFTEAVAQMVLDVLSQNTTLIAFEYDFYVNSVDERAREETIAKIMERIKENQRKASNTVEVKSTSPVISSMPTMPQIPIGQFHAHTHALISSAIIQPVQEYKFGPRPQVLVEAQKTNHIPATSIENTEVATVLNPLVETKETSAIQKTSIDIAPQTTEVVIDGQIFKLADYYDLEEIHTEEAGVIDRDIKSIADESKGSKFERLKHDAKIESDEVRDVSDEEIETTLDLSSKQAADSKKTDARLAKIIPSNVGTLGLFSAELQQQAPDINVESNVIQNPMFHAFAELAARSKL